MDQYLNCKNATPSLISRNTQNMVPLEDIGQNIVNPSKNQHQIIELKPSKNPLHLPCQYLQDLVGERGGYCVVLDKEIRGIAKESVKWSNKEYNL